MTDVLRTRIDGPSAWLGADIQDEPNWIVHIDEQGQHEIAAAVDHVQSSGLAIPFTADDFPLHSVAATIDDIPDRLEDGLGFVLLRGIDRSRYTAAECELIAWGLAMHLGAPISQNTRGHLLGHVRDEGRSFDDPTARGYQTAAKMDFHADQLPVDVLALFCVRPALSGGASALVSVGAVHNVLVDERPDLLDVLYAPFNLDWRGEEPPGSAPWYTSPMLSFAGGKVTSRVTSRQYFESVSRYGDELAVTDRQREALDVVQEICNRPQLPLSMMMQEGDMQFLNNHAILHARTAFEDHADADLKRHLLRLWIALPEERRRPLAPDLAERYAVVESGGIPTR